MLKGINQWCYPSGTSLDDVFSYSSKAGFDTVELNVGAEGPGFTMETDQTEAEKIAKLAASYNLGLQSISTDLLWKYPLSHKEEKIREKGSCVVRKQIEIASQIGADTVLVVPGIVDAETSYDDCYRRSAEEIAKLVPFAEEKNVKIGIENVWNKFLLSPMEMAAYIDQFDSPYVGAYFDVGNVLQFGYPEQWVNILGNRILKVHVKDFSVQVGNITGFVPLLAGDVDWKAVSAALKGIGYTGPLTAELSPYKLGPDYLADDTAKHLEWIIDQA